MGIHEDMVVPGILRTSERACFVVKFEISNDSGACGIGRANVVVAVEKSVGLIKVGGLGHIGGDDCVVHLALGDAVHLNRKEHGDAILFEHARQSDGFRGAPAMPV